MEDKTNHSWENLIFYNPLPISKEQLIKIIKTDHYDEICNALIGMAFYEIDLNFCKDIILNCVKFTNEDVRGASVLCIGHLARIHRSLPDELPTIVLNALNDKSKIVREQAANAMSDIRVFMPDLAKKLQK